MGLLDKVLGKDQEDEQIDSTAAGADVTAQPEPPAEIAEIAAVPEQPLVPEGIRAFDQQGREVIVPREDWRTQVLPGMLREVWDQPDQLYMLVLNSMNEGFFPEISDAAEHLYRTDTLPARGACMWGIALMQTDRLDEAEQVLDQFNAAHGEDGSVLTNLAKVYALRGDQDRAEATLWHALETEPNQENGLGWFAGIAQERGGDPAALAALERVRAMPTSWRAQLWLARGELAAGRMPEARALYREALTRVSRPVPGEFLMQMSGDLGAQGRLAELLEFTAPEFVPELHGMPVGNNLIKAYLDTGNLIAADAIRAHLATFGRPDWRQAIDFWTSEIARLRGGSATQQPPQPVQIGMLRVDGPIWLPGNSPANRLFGTKSIAGPSVTFLGGTAEAPQPDGQPEPHLLDVLGRMTRSLPLFLAEQVELLAAASGRAMIPWAVAQAPGQVGGFVVSGQRWPDEVAVQSVGQEVNRSDYVVSVHLDAETEPWTADLAFIRTADGARIGELLREFDPASPQSVTEGLHALAAEVIELLGAAQRTGEDAVYAVPADPDRFTDYLQRSEQLLAVRCAGMPGVPPTFLNGEREILDGALALCRAEPDNLAARLLLVELVAGIRGLRPQIAEEFGPGFQQFEAEHPMPVLARAFA